MPVRSARPARSFRAVARAALVAGATFAALGASLAACTAAPDATWNRGEAVGQLVAERARLERVHAVNLRDLAPFRWERLYLFAPATAVAVVRDSVGGSWDALAAAAPTNRPGAQLLVFTAGGEIVAAAALAPGAARFAPALLGRGYAPGEATFRVTRDSSAAPLLSR